MNKLKIALMGEAMLELSHPANGSTRLSYGGDVLNTAIYLARLGLHPYFVSALGVDPYSDRMIKDWERECVQTRYILRDPEKLPGIYAIQTDHVGERSFFYWRENSAARAFFAHPEHLESINFLREANWLYLSGITLSIYGERERELLTSIASKVISNGGEVIFDPNYRPKGWSNRQAAIDAMREFGRNVSIVLATIDDENDMHGQMEGERHAARWQDLGVQTVILKCGSRGAVIYDEEHSGCNVPVEVCEKPIDTTGAGDSFNAAYIAMKSWGHSNFEAASVGNELARTVIQHPGAIIPRTSMPAGFSGD